MSSAAARRGRGCVGLFALFALATNVPAPPQTARSGDDDPGTRRHVAGRVTRLGPESMRGIGGIWVVLHRVARDTAGPLDSVRSRADGRFSFRYSPSRNPDAVYFVSADYAGIAYFSQPLGGDASAAEIAVFDTTSGPLPLIVRGRHLVVSAPREDRTREVVEVYELSNDSSLTLVARDDAHPSWSAIIPASATDFRVGQGDISADAVRADSGRVRVYAAFAPGLRQLSYAYRLPSARFPLSVPLEQAVTLLEVLIEDPAGIASGARLAEVSPASVEGRTFKRFLAQDAPVNSVVRIVVPEITASRRTLHIAMVAIIVGAGMIAALALSFLRYSRSRA